MALASLSAFAEDAKADAAATPPPPPAPAPAPVVTPPPEPAPTATAAAPGATPPGGALTPEQQKFWEEFQKNPDVSKAQIEAEAKYVTARAEFQAGHFVEARELVEQALRIFPSHEGAQKLRQDVLAVLSVRDNRLQMAASWFHALQDIKTQEIAVRLASLMESGDRKMKEGDYAGAELDYDRVDVGLRSFPYQFDWGNLPADVQKKKLEARAESRQVEVKRQEAARDDAARAAALQADVQEIALKAKVDELLRRARTSYNRQDYKRAEVDAWNAYELDRRREDARKLYLDARHGGHVQFDSEYREVRLERLARVQEEIHKSMIPQNELLVYPEDWQLRALRKPQEIGNSKVEPWMASLRERLEQRVTFEFSDTSFEDVVNFLRQVTGVTIVTAPDVVAAGAGTVTLKVKDMRFGDALKWILELTNLKMALQDQAIFISKQPITGSVVLRMYDVTDLVSPVKDFPGRELAYNAGAGGAGGAGGFNLFKGAGAGAAAEEKATEPAALVDFIQKNVAPGQWEKEGVGIEQRGGSTLFVSQSPEVHSLVEQLLSNLRNQQALQVHVSVQVLDVHKDFFEEIGVEYTDTQGAAGQPDVAQSQLTYPQLINGAPAKPIPAAGVGIPAGGAANDGYARLNDTFAYNGSLTQVMPANGSASNSGTTPIGLEIDGSLHPFSFLGKDQINAIFSAFEQETDAQILEHPAITCFNGQRANASFIHQYAYIASYDIVNYTYDPKIEVLNYGDIIDVRPVVSSDRKYITMEIRPSSVIPVQFFVEDIVAPRIGAAGNFLVVYGFFDYPIELPNVEVRTLRSTVMMPDKGTLLLGGFANGLRQRTHSGVPFLSHIPFLGRLFSRDGTYDQNRKIFFMLNAEIVDLGEREKLQ
jgi:type II secretory pathway component GspD/PulD (secretin)